MKTVFVMLDSLNRHYLNAYGQSWVQTPNIDRLAAEGMRLDAAYCAAPVCVPSRMSFMTSRRPTASADSWARNTSRR